MDFMLGGLFAACINCMPLEVVQPVYVQPQVIVQPPQVVVQRPIYYPQPVYVYQELLYKRPLPKLFCVRSACEYRYYY